MASLPDAPPPYDTIVFDCDSTLSAIEGIDELAGAAPPEVRSRVQAMTRAAMAGEQPLQEVFGARLDLLRPSREQVEALGAAYVAHVVCGARATVRALGALDKRVLVLSGGLAPAVRVLARALDLAADQVHAVEVRFAASGRWAGWETDSPLARSGGKPRVLAALLSSGSRAALVGDGATDLEAAGSCARFVAFGGVVERPEVLARAAVAVTQRDLRAVLPHLLTARELDRLAALPAHAAAARAARAHVPKTP